MTKLDLSLLMWIQSLTYLNSVISSKLFKKEGEPLLKIESVNKKLIFYDFHKKPIMHFSEEGVQLYSWHCFWVKMWCWGQVVKIEGVIPNYNSLAEFSKN